MNGMRNSNNTKVGSTIAFSCNRGYRLVGLSSIECRRDGSWSGRIPACQCKLFARTELKRIVILIEQ